uniref:Astacin domain-containing protein n=1 Tax=Parastrongyloides trichosuri TaxID=131310 RepID=A0A0N4ZZC2_PARTI
AKEEELVRSKRTAIVKNHGKFDLPIKYYINFTENDFEISQQPKNKSKRTSTKSNKAKKNLQSAIYIIQNQTCIRFNESEVPLTSNQEGLVFNLKLDNRWLFGKSKQQPQYVNMSKYHYSVDDFLNNIGTALGMQLEINRHDRDDHIIINDVNLTERYPITNLTDDIKFLENISYDIGSMYQHCSGRYANSSFIDYIPKDSNYWDTFCLRKFSF